MRFKGKVALVTGAARGIGRAAAERLAAEGAEVAVNYCSSREAAEATAAAIGSAGGRAFVVQADVRVPADVERMFDLVRRRAGRLDVLVNNAGALVMGRAVGMPDDRLDEAIEINVKAVSRCVASALPLLPDGSARIVNIAATSALGTTAAGVAPHAVAKAALVLLTKQLAMELGPRGITVNAVCPGAVDTEATLPGGTLHEALREVRASQLRHTLLARIGTAADVAGVVAFLASGDAAFLTAQAISVDGGRTDFLTRSG